jgi:threonine-phosphate decarboxylase
MTELAPLHGGQLREVADRFGIPASELLDFSANINPEGPPASVLSALRQALNEPSILANYPDLDETELRHSLARYTGVRLENISVANGFVPLLDAALRILPIRSCLVPVPAFIEYRRALKRSRIELISQKLESSSSFSYETSDLVNGSHDAVLLANPQNPSGVLSRRETMLRLVEEAAKRNIYVLLDEAFIDYCPDASLVRETDRFANLIVFRSVTKFFGMAGLRVAYAIANTEPCRQLQEAIAPWSVTSLASLAAGLAVQDQAYAPHTIALNNERRNQMHSAIRKLGIHVYPSAANFLLLRLPGSIDCQQFWERLIREHHIVLRNCANYEALGDQHLRAAVRKDAENQRLIEALAHEVEKEQGRIGIASQSG